jgi:GAF domain-containing protein
MRQNPNAPGHKWNDAIMYELHPKGFTASPASGVEHPGTYRGLGEKAAYLKELGITIVQDAAVDPNFRDNPIVNGPPHIRFYAGVPITFGNKLRIGNLCVLDTVPRSLDYGHQLFLKNAAEITQAEIERIARETFQKLAPVF